MGSEGTAVVMETAHFECELDGYGRILPWPGARRVCRHPTNGKRPRGGADGRVFPWGSQFGRDRMNSLESGLQSVVPVGSCPHGASPDGVLDLAGNVWKWVAD